MGAGKSSLDAATSGEIFRKDHPMILACNRHQALILPARMAYVADGYVAGQVVARNTVSGLYEKYDDGASSGLDTAAGVLLHDVEPASGSSELARVVFEGKVFEDKLTGLDSAAKTDLKARSIVDATGAQILTF